MTAERIRLTVSITPETHATFSKIAEVSGTSLGRCIGDWLADTGEGAQFVLSKMQEARSAPKRVMRELHAMALGELADLDQMIDDQETKVASRRPGRARELASADVPVASTPRPPSSHTGVNPGKTLTPPPPKPGFYSALNPAGERVLLPVGKAFDRHGVVSDVPKRRAR